MINRIWIAMIWIAIAAGAAPAATYFVATDGNNNNPGSTGQPWRTVTHGVSQLSAGDTLVIRDGVYLDQLYVTTSGTAANRITIRAENDGQVIIDGEDARRPARINGSHITVEGIVFMNSSGHVVNISGRHNILRRCSAYWGPDQGNPGNGIGVGGFHNLVEDCVVGGVTNHGLISHSNVGDRRYNTFRRCFSVGSNFPGGQDRERFPPGDDRLGFTNLNIYGVSNCIVENCITWGGVRSNGASIHSATFRPGYMCRDNRVLGSIFLNSPMGGLITGYGYKNSDNHFEHCVVQGNRQGIRQLHNDDPDNGNDTWKNITVIGNEIGVTASSGNTSRFVNLAVHNNGRGFSGSDPYLLEYSNSHGNPVDPWPGARGEGNISVDPGFRGLVVPSTSPLSEAGKDGDDIGATIYYRYVDGELTDEPLWPWPMQDRIKTELGIDLMAELEARFGPIEPPVRHVEVLRPFGGELYLAGDIMAVSWRTNLETAGSAVRIDLESAGRGPVAELGTVWHPDGENIETFTVPMIQAREDYRVRVTSSWDPALWALGAHFEIRHPARPKSRVGFWRRLQ